MSTIVISNSNNTIAVILYERYTKEMDDADRQRNSDDLEVLSEFNNKIINMIIENNSMLPRPWGQKNIFAVPVIPEQTSILASVEEIIGLPETLYSKENKIMACGISWTGSDSNTSGLKSHINEICAPKV